jgi:hypothetical protein
MNGELMVNENLPRFGAYVLIAYAMINLFLEKKFVLHKRYRSFKHMLRTVFWFEHPEYILKENVNPNVVKLLERMNNVGVFVIWVAMIFFTFIGISKNLQ